MSTIMVVCASERRLVSWGSVGACKPTAEKKGLSPEAAVDRSWTLLASAPK